MNELGDGVGNAADFATKTHRAAKVTHNVLTAAQIATGVGVVYVAGKKLLVDYTLGVAARKAALAAGAWAASAVAAEAAQYAMEYLGVPEEYRYFIGLGLDAYQIFANIKTLRALAKLKGPFCFVAGTQVITGQNPDGTLSTRSIEDLKVGDLVLARDQNDANDDLDLRRVTNVFRKTSDHIQTVLIEGDDGNVETIQTTDEHPFYVDGRGWVGAGDLQEGDRVQETDGTWQSVLRSVREEFADGITVYNLEVEGDHTYFVEDGRGAVDAVWVHNSCGDLKKIDNRVIKSGVDAHALKDAYVPNQGSKFNIAEDVATGQLYLVPVRAGELPNQPLGITLQEALNLYPR